MRFSPRCSWPFGERSARSPLRPTYTGQGTSARSLRRHSSSAHARGFVSTSCSTGLAAASSQPYDRDFARQMTLVFERDLALSMPYTLAHCRRRSWREKFEEVVVNPIRCNGRQEQAGRTGPHSLSCRHQRVGGNGWLGCTPRRLAPFCIQYADGAHLSVCQPLVGSAGRETHRARDVERNRDHFALYRPTQRPHLLQLIESLQDRGERDLRLELEQPHRKRSSDGEHRQIYRVCRDGDVDIAAAILAAHLQGTGAMLAEQIQARPARSAGAP